MSGNAVKQRHRSSTSMKLALVTSVIVIALVLVAVAGFPGSHAINVANDNTTKANALKEPIQRVWHAEIYVRMMGDWVALELKGKAKDGDKAKAETHDDIIQKNIDRIQSSAMISQLPSFPNLVKSYEVWKNLRTQHLVPMAYAIKDGPNYAKDLWIYGLETFKSGPQDSMALIAAFEGNLTRVGTELDNYISKRRVEAERAQIGMIVGVGVMALLGVVIAVVLSVAISKRIVGSIRRVSRGLENMASGDLTVHMDVESNDEAGDVARSVNKANESLQELIAGTSEVSTKVKQAPRNVNATLEGVSQSTTQTNELIDQVDQSSAQVSSNVSTVATGAEEVGAPIREISSNVTEAARVAQNATEVAVRANEVVAKLDESSQEIGKVMKIITKIAEQTNLLALNATIGTARTRDAGKELVVVTGEVRDSAAETGTATEEISQCTEQIQHDTSGVVEAIAGISQIVSQVSDLQTTIVSAVEEQAATTNEMSRSTQDATTMVGEINTVISSVAQGGGEITQTVLELQAATREMEELSQGLDEHLSGFRV